jgi:predicted transcriptional regulator
MAELVLKLDDHLATRLSMIAQEQYDGDPNAVVSDALRLLFLQPIQKDRRKIAQLIDDIRVEVQAAGGVTEKEIDQLIKEYRQQKRAGK